MALLCIYHLTSFSSLWLALVIFTDNIPSYILEFNSDIPLKSIQTSLLYIMLIVSFFRDTTTISTEHDFSP